MLQFYSSSMNLIIKWHTLVIYSILISITIQYSNLLYHDSLLFCNFLSAMNTTNGEETDLIVKGLAGLD